MRRWCAVVAILVLAACSQGLTEEIFPTSTTEPIVMTTTAAPTTTPTHVRPIGGQLVKLDLATFEPIGGLDPIPFGSSSWTTASVDGEWMAIFDWAEVTPIEVATWTSTGPFDVPRHSAGVIHGGRFYSYDQMTGAVSFMDLLSGQRTDLGLWQPDLGLWDELHMVSDHRMAGLGEIVDGADVHFSVFVVDTASGETREIPVGQIQHIDNNTGIFDGDYEIPEIDSPGLAWSGDHLYIAHAEALEVTAVDLETGDVDIHHLEATSWLDRLFAFWVPSATAKGPSMGTYSSAALSVDGRFLFISGNRYAVTESADGFLGEESEPLGLIIVDTETWEIAARSDLGVQFVRNAGNTIVAVGTRSTSPWLEDIFTLSMDRSESLSVEGPFPVGGGGCQPTRDGVSMVCSEYVGDTQLLRVVDMRTSEILDGAVIGQEDYLNENGVLVDWSPIGG